MLEYHCQEGRAIQYFAVKGAEWQYDPRYKLYTDGGVDTFDGRLEISELQRNILIPPHHCIQTTVSQLKTQIIQLMQEQEDLQKKNFSAK